MTSPTLRNTEKKTEKGTGKEAPVAEVKQGTFISPYEAEH